MQELTLREIQLSGLEILSEFDRICRVNGLRYSLAGGTLLGAVRHKGFIPWDDDIDVCMPRPDYEKFREIFTDTGRYGLSGAAYPFLKLVDKQIRIEKQNGHGEVPFLWLDIFPVDGLPEDIARVKKIYKKSTFYRKVIIFSKWQSLERYDGSHSKFVAALGKIFVKLYGVQRAVRKSLQLAQKNCYETSDFCGVVTWGCYGVGERVIKAEFEKTIEIEFEHRSFQAMSCWYSYLSGIYGDYMTLPPPDKRVTHKFKAYRMDD